MATPTRTAADRVGDRRPTLLLVSLGLLAAATLLFALGVLAERSSEPRPSTGSAVGGHQEGSGDEASEHRDPAAPDAEQGPAGLNPEGLPSVVAAIAASAGAGAVLWFWWRRRVALALVIAFAAGFAVLDGREVVYQLASGQPPLAGLAIGVTVLHLATAGAALLLIRVTASSPEARTGVL